MDDGLMKTLLEQARTIAIVGASERPGRPVDSAARYLIEAGYDIVPVRQARKSVWGLDCFPDLASVTRPIDVVNVFRAPEHCGGHALETLRLSPRPRLFWLQLGIESPEAEKTLATSGIAYVQNACLMLEHKRLLGGHARGASGK